MKQNIIARLFKMIGNISKKKGDNGDFYTKPVVDKKLKEAEAAAKAFMQRSAKRSVRLRKRSRQGSIRQTPNLTQKLIR